MATNLVEEGRGGSVPLELLHFASGQLQIRDGVQPRIHANRADVQLEVAGASLAEAAGRLYAQAMRSGHRQRRS